MEASHPITPPLDLSLSLSGEMGPATSPQVPVIDFTGLDSASSGSDRWAAVRALVMEALEAYCCFEAVYDKVTPELRKALFEKGMKEVFGLPLDVKMRNKSDTKYLGYIGQIPTLDYESVIIDDSTTPEGVHRFADLMWPGGNPSFCNTAQSYSKQLSELDQMVRRMILESFGVEHDLDSHIHSVTYKLRVSEYKAQQAEGDTVLPDHLDANLLTIVCQHEIEGLEVHTKDGDWVHINPLPNSFTVLLGETMEAWTNGVLHPTLHHVRMTGTEPRYSAIFLTFPKDGHMVHAPKELVDDEHPVLFKPFEFKDWFSFRFSEEASKAKHALKAYCGVGGEEVVA